MNIWIAPASDGGATANLPKSLSQPITQQKRDEMGLPADVKHAWGTTFSERKKGFVLDRMQEGDVCLFYTQSPDAAEKRYCWAATIAKTNQSRRWAEVIWGDGNFELIYLLREPVRINVSCEQLHQLLGKFKPDNPDYLKSAPQGLMPLDSAVVEAVRGKFGSLEAWVASLGTKTPSKTKTEKDKTVTTQPESPSAKESEHLKHIADYLRRCKFILSADDLLNFYAALRSKPFVILAGISGTGKSRLVRLFAEAIGANVDNGRFHMIPVKPDWNDSSDLIGYTDLNGKFQPGALVPILLQAHGNPKKPFFVCLDEMNLARVEHYFSDFLSEIESRRRVSGKIVTDPVLQAEQLAAMVSGKLPDSAKDVLEGLKKGHESLGLPENLYVVGTVNMDETTQPFSRKVLDRANTIECSSINLLAGMDGGAATEVAALDLDNDFLLPPFLTMSDLLSEHSDVATEVAQQLSDLNGLLERANFHIGYRVRDESAAYSVLARAIGMTAEQAFEFIVLQKLLPRIQGSSQRLESLLFELLQRFNSAEESMELNDPDLNEKLVAIRTNTTTSPVVRKIAGMLLAYREENFTSFWIA
jgi:hypothetical protein